MTEEAGTTKKMGAGERELIRKHAEILHVLSNPLRHEIVHWLVRGPMTAGELVEASGASKSNVSQHLALLKSYGLVEPERDGRHKRFRIAYPELAEACALIDQILLDQAERALSLQGR